MTESELKVSLQAIKNEVQSLDMGHVTFLNLDSYYNFVSGGVHPSRLRELIDGIADYIPMSVSDQHMDMFIKATATGNDEVLSHIEEYFDKVSKINFLNSVYQARSDAKWDEILKICLTLRGIKEEAAQS